MDNYDDLQDLLLDLNHLDETRRNAAYDFLVRMGSAVVPGLVEFDYRAGLLSVIRV
jgi:hypothetical protein